MKAKLTLIIPLVILLTILFIPFNLAYAQDEEPSITVEDQEIGEDNMVTIAEVVSPVEGWIVIHQEEDGAPGPVIGEAMVETGTNSDVTVEIDPDMVTDTLYAMLHEDTGEMGQFDFPDADPPVTDEEGNVVMESFSVTLAEPAEEEVDEPEVMEEEPEPVEEPEAVEEEEPEPEELPTTGFEFFNYYMIIIAAVVLSAGTLGLVLIRKQKE
jgi:LPXTG-motif cell wall-anchored protein